MPHTIEPTTSAVAGLGTAAWSERTGGHLTFAEKRSLLAPLAGAQARNAAGRLAMGVGWHPGRRWHIDPEQLLAPRTILTRVARAHATDQLSTALLNHSERTYAFGAALSAVEGIDVDLELLF